MKYLLIPIFFVYLFHLACQHNQAANDPIKNASQAIDSVKIKELKSYVDSINANRRNMKPIKINPNLKSEDDKLLAVKDSLGNLVFARLDLVGEDTVTREYFYFKDNVVVNYQLMVWYKTALPPYAWGINLYLDDNKVAGAEERFVELTTDERPAKLLSQPAMPPTVDVDSIVQLLKKRIEPIKNDVDKHDPRPE